MLHCKYEVAVSDFVHRSLAQNVSSDFFKRYILLSRLKTTPSSIFDVNNERDDGLDAAIFHVELGIRVCC